MTTQPQGRAFTVGEYYRMAEANTTNHTTDPLLHLFSNC